MPGTAEGRKTHSWGAPPIAFLLPHRSILLHPLSAAGDIRSFGAASLVGLGKSLQYAGFSELVLEVLRKEGGQLWQSSLDSLKAHSRATEVCKFKHRDEVYSVLNTHHFQGEEQ